MRKRILDPILPEGSQPTDEWLDLDTLADVEVTSEEASHPIESALLPNRGTGWIAAGPGPQVVRLLFQRPQQVRRIWLTFSDAETERTQEFTLRWSSDAGQTFQDIARQQWNFSPRGSVCESEDYRVDLPAVVVLELTIVPDIGGGSARACLAEWRVA